jgi:mono/diheme cytochrome c family protein/uncharacterized protein YceK
MMKKLSVILFFMIAAVLAGCSDVRRHPGRDYMPDMRYSRAYETYSPHDNLAALGINYTGMPVPGTVKRGEVFPFPIPKDAEGDSTNYVAAKQVPNPLPRPNKELMKEAERMYLINCGICHGTKLDGNGPLYNDGNGPYPAAPKNLIGDPVVSRMPDGQMFYSITYGKGQMGPYGPQLSTSQRWNIVHYIRAKQAEKNGGPAVMGATEPSAAAAATVTGTTGSSDPAAGSPADTTRSNN